MPTVILMDVSLSMCRSVPSKESADVLSIKSLAVSGLTAFLDYLTANCRLEFVSLMFFSSLWERSVSFTRDYESIKAALIDDDHYYDKTNIINGLGGIQELVQEEWGSTVPIQVILVTDGNVGINAFRSKKGAAEGEEELTNKWPIPFPFPCKLDVVCIASPADSCLQSSLPYYEKLIDVSNSGLSNSALSSGHSDSGQLWIPESPQITLKMVQSLFTKLAETNYQPFKGKLSFGSLSCSVSLFPPLEPFTQVNDFETVVAKPSSEIKICGFLDISEVASPPVHSRHLMFALPMAREQLVACPSILTINTNSSNPANESASTAADLEEALTTMCSEEGKQPSLCVLLHGSLKVESMVAICQVGSDPDWYGMLYSWADSKKKSNLMLSTFKCGADCVAWLGSFKLLGMPSLSLKATPSQVNRFEGRKSYTQNTVVWIRQSWLQSDIQKVLRLAKKLPEKTPNFYKELNRFRRAALAFGFLEILEGMARILERECTLLPGTSHPEAALQLTHAVNALRVEPSAESYSSHITPLKTKFHSE